MFQAISLMKEPSKGTGSLIHKCRVGNASTWCDLCKIVKTISLQTEDRCILL